MCFKFLKVSRFCILSYDIYCRGLSIAFSVCYDHILLRKEVIGMRHYNLYQTSPQTCDLMLYIWDPALLAITKWTKEWHLSHRLVRCLNADGVLTKGLELYLFSVCPTVAVQRIKLTKFEFHRVSWFLIVEVKAIEKKIVFVTPKWWHIYRHQLMKSDQWQRHQSYSTFPNEALVILDVLKHTLLINTVTFGALGMSLFFTTRKCLAWRF